jgi:2,3-dihydroxy-p-cumate/2,3-dihydroxybenzoate 3,4-dioxygenase
MTAPFRYKRLGYLVFDVSDIDRSTRFATEVFGLDLVSETTDGCRFFRGGQHHHDIVFRQAETPMVARSAWELEDEGELAKAYEHFGRLGLSPAWVPERECRELEIENAFRVVDNKIGLTWEYFIDMTVIPSPRSNRLTGFQGGKHFGLTVGDGKDASRFLLDDMGFVLSDYFEGHVVTLLRAWPNSNHHSLALLGGSDGPVRFHHVAFMVDAIDDIGCLFNRVKRLGVDIHFGIGRHPTSGSVHIYIYDHDNFVWEYTWGMEQFPEEGARPARRMSSAPEDFDLWGAVPDNSRKYQLPQVLARTPAKLEAATAQVSSV